MDALMLSSVKKLDSRPRNGRRIGELSDAWNPALFLASHT